jgi:hypothetical protein
MWIIPTAYNWIGDISTYFFVRDMSPRLPEIGPDWDCSSSIKKFDGLEIYQQAPLKDEQGFRCLLPKSAAKECDILECGLFNLSITRPPILRRAFIFLGLRFIIRTIICNGK